jgi:4-amino-4-deoxy-L-arabinose transferase-like glycosyltransferase
VYYASFWFTMQSMRWSKGLYWWWLPVGVYLITRLYGLTLLPVFADEAIYIRWAQIISQEPAKYLFLPLYDGKTPLMMWVLTLFLPLTPLDPLLAARLMSVAFGLGSMMVLALLTKEIGGNTRAMKWAAWLYVLTPFAFWHERLALTDTPLVFLLALTTWGLLKMKRRRTWKMTVITGAGFGLAIITKLPALLFIPLFIIIYWLLPPYLTTKQRLPGWLRLLGMIFIGVGVLSLMRVSPWFPFLFTRSGDFTVGLGALVSGELGHIGYNLKNFLWWQGWYTGFLFILPILTILAKGGRIRGAWWLMALVTALPFIITGKIVYSRYYLPMLVFLIPAAALAMDHLWQTRKLVAGLIGAVIVLQAIWFMQPAWTNVYQLRLPKADQEQYLTLWSAGFGIPEVRDLIIDQAVEGEVVVGTEGYFGTLPDGLLMYFDRSPIIKQVEIFGVGQPVLGLPESLKEKSQMKPTYLLVNTSRLDFDYEACCEVVGRYPRPYGGTEAWLLYVTPTN